MKELTLARGWQLWANKPHHASCVAGTGQGPCQQYLHLRMPYYAVGIREQVPKRSTTPRPEHTCNVHIGCCGRDPDCKPLRCNHT